MNSWLAFFFGICLGGFLSYGSLGIYGYVLLKRSDDDES